LDGELIMNDIFIGVISAVIALVAAVVSVYFSRKSLRVSALSARMQYYSDLREWAREVANALSDAIHLCEVNQDIMPRKNFFETRHDIKIRLSALIDQGRWFFPNKTSGAAAKGFEKEKAFQGVRLTVLDSIVFTYKLVKNMESGTCQVSENTKADMVTQKRVFVSEIQLALDPHTLSREFAQLSGNKSQYSELD